MTPPTTSRGPVEPGRATGSTPDRTEQGPGPGTPVPVTLLLFAAARQAAGCSSARLEAVTVTDVLDQARHRFGEDFSTVLDGSRVWVNGEPVSGGDWLSAGDEVAVLPPVSGG